MSLDINRSDCCFSKELFLPFHLADPAGILFFGHIFSLSHQLFETFILEKLGIHWTEWFQNPEWVVPIKSAEAAYHLPLQAGSSCEATLEISALRTHSFELTASFSQKNVLCSHVKLAAVFCSRLELKKIPIPLSILKKLQKTQKA